METIEMLEDGVDFMKKVKQLEKLESLEELHRQVSLAHKEILDKINALQNNKNSKEYQNLKSLEEELYLRKVILYREYRNKQYSSCNHIWVDRIKAYDQLDGKTHTYCGCIKCGLDGLVLYREDSTHLSDTFIGDFNIMYTFFKEHPNIQGTKGIDTGISCNFILARAIYQKIKEVHPDINDDTAIKYLNVALYFIRNKKVSEARKANRAKRLVLEKKFNKWDESAIKHNFGQWVGWND